MTASPAVATVATTPNQSERDWARIELVAPVLASTSGRDFGADRGVAAAGKCDRGRRRAAAVLRLSDRESSRHELLRRGSGGEIEGFKKRWPPGSTAKGIGHPELP